MNKILLLSILINLGIASASYAQSPSINNNIIEQQLVLDQLKYGTNYISIGNISVHIIEKVKLSPDTAEFSITYLTEGSTPNEASNRNASNMKKLVEYLNELGITEKDLTTLSYQNYEKIQQQPIANVEGGLNKTTLTAHVSIEKNKFFDALKLLEDNGIYDLKHVSSYDGIYQFKMTEIGNDADTTKKLAQDKFKTLESLLKKLNIQKLTIEEYRNDKIDPGTETIKKYYVKNTVKIKVTHFDHLGKIIAQAQELKMTVNNDINYSVSNEAKNSIIQSYESGILAKLTAKAERLLGSNQSRYQLGVPMSLNSGENDSSDSYRPRHYAYSESVVNAGQTQLFSADNVEIQPPSEYELTLSMSGTFEIVKPVATVKNK